MELDGKFALVTGGARRVGRAIALALARGGANVAVHYNSSAAEAEKVAGEICAIGRRAETIQADLSHPGEIKKMFAELAASFGRLDVLVNCAAVYDRTPLETLTAEQWDRQFAVNARAPALCISGALPLMAGGGAIINIADIGAEKGWGGYPAYCASKAALISLTKSAARALAKSNIRVNCVSPGVAVWQEGLDETVKKKVVSRIPMNRPGRPEDIAAAVVFLARQDYITAQNLRVDGGWCMG